MTTIPLITAVVKLFNNLLEGTKGRRTRRALLFYRRMGKRALKLYPKLRKDKHFMKYRDIAEKNSIRK